VDLTIATATIAAAGSALTAAGRAAPDAPVAACPEWDVSALIRHVGRVHGWAAAIVRTGERSPFPEEPGAGSIADWADDQRAALLELLATADPDRPVWAFGPIVPAAFWWRRQCHETAMHAWDGTAAAGEPWAIPGEVAMDGLDELLEWFLPRSLSRDNEWATGQTVHFHRTDGDGERLLTLANPPTLQEGHAKGDLAVRGGASDLLRWAMNRPATVEVFGDDTLATLWREKVRF
jgi:uncharacterized protein (TIGR03083 family)